MVRVGLHEKVMSEQRLEVGEGETMQVFGWRASQSEGAASAKALRWENVWHAGGTGRRLVVLEQRSRGGEWQR